ncbi:MAG TPA: BACON domain-containing carbohydrate-binding protein, partial [Blastocatellia bacterium]|nr:BACON domain-containing carbohydrate-binding protein [Blastocatellia bacterium]
MLKNKTNNSRLMRNDRSRKRNVVIVAGVLSLFASWTLLAYSGALDPLFRHKGGNAAPVAVQSFNSNSPSKEYIYGGGRLIATEEPAGCAYSISPISQSFTSSAGTGSVNVTAGAGCAWTATSNATWITITAGSSGTGNGTVSYSVAANSGAARTGTVTIAGQTFTVSQAAASCTYSISPTSQSFTSSGGTGSVNVTAGAGCGWTATSNATWITITAGSSGTGNGTVSYSVAANSGAARTGTVTIAGQTFTVSQAAASCTYSISPTSQSSTSSGGTGSVNVTAGAGCAWTATSNATWITITAGSSGAGNGTVSYSVAANTGPARSGTLTIAGQSFTINQSSGCTYAISPTSQSFTSSAATGSVNVTSSAGCVWTATSNAAWITITAGSSGAGNGTVSYSVAANSGAARTGTITIAGQTFTVTQAAAAGGVPNAPSGLTAFAVSPNQINLQWTDNSTNESGFKILLMGGNGSFVLDTVAANVTTYSDMTVNPCSQTCYQIKAFNASGDSAGSNQACAFTQGCDETTATDAQCSATPGRDTSIAHRFLTWANELSVVVHAASTANEAKARNTLPSNNASLFLFGLAGFCLLLLILTGYKAAVRVATDLLSRTRRWRVRIFVSLIIIALALPLSPHQAQFAAVEAGKFLHANVARLRDVVKRGPATKQISTQSFDPPGQSSLVHHFKLCPRKLLLYPGENFTLVPLALDRDKEVVEGAAFEWQSKNADVAGISSTGEVIAISPGHTQVEVSAGSAIGKVNVEVRAGSRPAYTDRKKADDDWEAEHGHDCDAPDDDPAPSQGIDKRETERNLAVSSGISSREDSGNEVSAIQAYATGLTPARERLVAARAASVNRPGFKTSHPAMLRGVREPAPESLLGHATLTKPAEAQPMLAGPSSQNGNGGLLDGSSPDIASIAAAAPFNAVGQPRFAPMEFSQGSAAKTRNNLGSYNYSFSAPVLGLGGRGIGVNLALTYNSRVWNKDNANTMTFNYQKGWPAPGWTLGYGRLIDNYDNTGSGDLSGVGQANAPGSYLLIQPDGTRIHLQQTYDSASGRWSHNSKDGSFISFNPLNGKLRYTDGTLVTFDLINNRRLPSSIRTNNGDTITIAYKTFVKNNPDPSLNFPFRWAIDYIYDSLGRYVRFNYDSTPRLVSITAKDKGGATDRVLCQIDYTDITLNYNFSGSITTVNAPAANSLITVVRRIYWPATGRGYLFPDYNSYGMARKVSMRIGMTASGDGTEAAYTRYDYPSVGTQVGGLNDSPQFTNRYEWWQDKIDGLTETMYTYSRSTDTVAGTEIDKVSYPNGIDMVTTSGNDQTGDPGDFGHVVKTEMKVGTNPPLRTSQQSYITDSSGGQQIGQVTATDEAGNIAKTTYDYYASYGRVQNVNEYGFSSAVQRKTTFFYSDNAGLLGLNMTGVVTEVRVFNGAGGLVAKTVNEIDNYTVNTLMDYGVSAPNHDYSGFGVTGTSRGNVTKVTMSVLPGTATISRSFKYDVFGNVVRADVSCCQTKTTAFSSATWFSQPDSVTDGDPLQAPHLTTSFSYDFSTGLALSTTDPNGQPTSFDYDSAWRVKTINSATGASTLTQFDKDSNQNDLLSYFQRVTYLEADGITTRTITSRSWFDGAGRVLRAGTAAGASPTSYDAVKTEYDSMGRVSRQSNPYTGDVNGNGSPAFWTSNTYDPQSRVTTVTLPDTQTIQTEYNGAIVTVTDQVNRKRQSQVDGLGRLIGVTEQDPATGVLSLATTYSYDTLDNLTGVNQGGQTRSFAYDSLGRMT